MNTNEILDLAIIADDLTSAADGAAPFVSCGHRAWIGRGQPPDQAVPVLAIDTGSRSVNASQAVERVVESTRQLSSRHILYKTVDSTLRGHVSEEIEACFWSSGRKTLVFAPAFPSAGRTTVDGIQFFDGVPVAETVYGRDPVHPARHSALESLVPPSIKNVILLDASTQDQLDAQVRDLPSPESILWVGSPGMAIALAKRFSSPPDAIPNAKGNSSILVVVGSANPCSHRQADAAAQLSGVTVLRGPAERQDDPHAVLSAITELAVNMLRTGNIGAVVATGGDTMDAILNRLGVREFEVLQELDPGFPLGRAVLHGGRELLIAMKAGGFGDDNVLRRAAMSLRSSLLLSNKVHP